MKYLTGNIKQNDDIKDVPSNFIKNKYSSLEYHLISKGLKEFYNINKFKVLYTSNGKPYLDNDIHISITNSNDLVVVAFNEDNFGVDMEYYKNINPHLKKILNIDSNLNDKEYIIEFCKREAIIKLEDIKLVNINDIDTSIYSFKIIERENYVIVFAFKGGL